MKKNFAVIILMLLIAYDLFAQCSDAGICSLRDYQRMQETKSSRHRVGISYIYGRSGKTDDVTYHTVQLHGALTFFEGAQVSFILPYNVQSGPLGKVSGIGDVIIIWNQEVVQGDVLSLKFQAGGKFASGDANGNSTLPQLYQSSLGSNDVLLGASVLLLQWDGTIGYQIAGGRNSNAVTRLLRSDDILLRVGHTLSFEKLTLHPSFLFIQRLGNSSIKNVSYPNGEEFIELPDSAPAQLNAQVEGNYSVSDIYSIEASVAFPFLQRKVNIDGLTRAITISCGMSISL